MSGVLQQLPRTTARIAVDFSDGRSSVGTGFFLSFDPEVDGGGIALVTNRHVVSGGTVARIVLSAADKSGVIQHKEITISPLQQNCFYHPDPTIDLACIPAGGLWRNLAKEGLSCLHFTMGIDSIPADESSIGDIEDILMVGYPSGLYDEVNNRPLVRRGVTATSYSVDYGGRPQFLIDAAVYPGSSGSPIVIANHGGFTNAGLLMGTRFQLLGVAFAVHKFSADGQIRQVPIPAGTAAISTTLIPMNLGYCLKARLLTDLIEVAKRARPPQSSGASGLSAARPLHPLFGGYLIR